MHDCTFSRIAKKGKGKKSDGTKSIALNGITTAASFVSRDLQAGYFVDKIITHQYTTIRILSYKGNYVLWKTELVSRNSPVVMKTKSKI